MQIANVSVLPVDLSLQHPVRMAGTGEIRSIGAVFLQLDLKDGRTAWGCGLAHPDLTGGNLEELQAACERGRDILPSLSPLNVEYALAQLEGVLGENAAALCAYSLALYDALGLAAGMPLYRLLGAYHHKLQTSATIPLASEEETVEMARERAAQGFRILKIKGGLDAEDDVHRLSAVRRALPGITLRLDADGGYSVQQALDVAHILGEQVEMLEQPTPAHDLDALWQVTRHSPVPVLADQSVDTPASALEVAAHRCADGFSVKLGTCGGIARARQMEAIARAARLTLMVSCLLEPALLTAAGLHFALSSPAVRYGDLDGYLDIKDDPTVTGFRCQEGWLIATDVPGLGCTVEI